MTDTPPTAMQLFAAEFVRECKPLLAQIAAEDRLNEALTKCQIAREMKIAPILVQALIDAGTLKTLEDLGQRVSRRELERYTAGRRRTK